MLSFFIYLDEGKKSSDDKTSKLAEISVEVADKTLKLADILAKLADKTPKPADIRFQRVVEIKGNVIGTARFKQTNKKRVLNSSFFQKDSKNQRRQLKLSFFNTLIS